jgi:hypothetical protein
MYATGEVCESTACREKSAGCREATNRMVTRRCRDREGDTLIACIGSLFRNFMYLLSRRRTSSFERQQKEKISWISSTSRRLRPNLCMSQVRVLAKQSRRRKEKSLGVMILPFMPRAAPVGRRISRKTKASVLNHQSIRAVHTYKRHKHACSGQSWSASSFTYHRFAIVRKICRCKKGDIFSHRASEKSGLRQVSVSRKA